MNRKLKRRSMIIAAILSLTVLIAFTGCGSGRPGESAPEKKVKSYGSGIMISDIKSSYSVDRTAEKNQMKPLWNVDPGASFVIHFNSRVEPLLAVTVHTEPTCRDTSRINVMTNLFVPKEGTGVDVAVSPGQAVLEEMDESIDPGESWGHAPVYYLCIHYDRFSEDVKKLDKPAAIPFTVAADASTPTVSSVILPDGQFALKWNPVKDAAGYEIYKTSVVSLASEEHKGYLSDVTRADVGYSGDVPKKIAEVSADTTLFTDFLADDEFAGSDLVKGTTLEKNSDGSIYVQNGFTGDVFYVKAVNKDGGKSNFSMAQEKWKYDSMLPWMIDDHIYTLDSFGFPETINIKMRDDSVVSYPVDFKLKEVNKYGVPHYEYRARGTALGGICEVDYKLKDLDWPEEHRSRAALNAGLFRITNPISIVPEIDAATVTDSSGKKVLTDTSAEYRPKSSELWAYPKETRMNIIDMDLASMFSSGVPVSRTPEDIIEQYGSIYDTYELVGTTEDDESAGSNFVDEQQDTTDKDIASADQWEVPDTPYLFFADSAEEEYLARMMIEGEEQIDISAFPKLQDTTWLSDILNKVTFQNPYILGVEGYAYNSDYRILYVTYAMSASEIKKKQKKIDEEAEKIVNSSISAGMSDEEKINALWTALEDSTEYDSEACGKAEENNYQSVPPEYADAFNAYGIICEKTGVCQSYALAYKLLLEKAGVDSVVLTGYAAQTQPHAWNAVQLGGSWYWMDVTNNYHNSGVEYLLYEASSDDAWQQDYILDDRYELNGSLGFVENHDNSRNYYYRNEMVAYSAADIPEAAANAYKKRRGNMFAVKMANGADSDSMTQEIMNSTAQKLLESGASQSELGNLRYAFFQNYLLFMEGGSGDET